MTPRSQTRPGKFVLVFWLALSIAFAEVQPPATVHIYRYKLTIGTASHPSVSCDASPVVRIQNGRVYTMQVPARHHNFSTSGNPGGIEIAMEPGKEYFVRIDFPPNASFAVGAIPVLVTPEQGRKETEKLRPLDGRFIEDAACGEAH